MGDTLNETRQMLVGALNGDLSWPTGAWEVLSEWDALVGRVRELARVVEAYRELHAQVCDDYWADDECACGGRQLLAAVGASKAAPGEERA